MPGHHLMLGHVRAGRVQAEDTDQGRRRWWWTGTTMHIPRPLRWFLDELERAGRIVVDGAAVTEHEEAA